MLGLDLSFHSFRSKSLKNISSHNFNWSLICYNVLVEDQLWAERSTDIYIQLSNVLTDHFSNSFPEKTAKDIPMKFSQCPFKTIFYRLPLSNRGIYLQIIHLRRKAIFTFYGTCIACVNNITFQIRKTKNIARLVTR